jgi:hypothetical protein
VIDWDKAIYRLGEAARPMTMCAAGLGFFAALLVPYVTADKLVAAGVVVTALFAVKGQDKRAEIQADAQVKMAAVTTEPKAKPKPKKETKS